MLLFLALCTALQTLGGASSLPPHPTGSVATANLIGVVAPECPACSDDGGQQFRTAYSIVQSCILTIFACVWKSIHPNIDGPTDSGWTRLKRRLVIMLFALLAPELVLYWALNQRASAQVIADMYNKEFVRHQGMSLALQRLYYGLQALPQRQERQRNLCGERLLAGFSLYPKI